MYSGQVVPVRVAKLMVMSRRAGVGACPAHTATNTKKLAAIVFTDDVRYVLVVFIADIFKQIGVRLEHGMPVHSERPSVSSWIGNGGFDIQMTQIGAAETLDDM